MFKQLFNIKNFIKFKKPSLILKLFKKINYYPGLKCGYSRSKLYKKIEIYFTIFFAKKNKVFKNIFFSEDSSVDNNHYFKFDRDECLDSLQLESIKKNGIIVLENVLDAEEFSKIKAEINEMVISEQVKKNGEINLVRTDDLYKLSLNYDIQKSKRLTEISDVVSSKIYGIKVEPTSSIIFTKAIKVPEKTYSGDNNLHPDRYLPNLKIFFYTKNVSLDEAPFSYAVGSHKINRNYLNYYLENESYIFDDRNPKSEIFL